MPRRVRIIAGEWGGRWLDVIDSPGLRPTGNRVRESLFNWLQMKVPGARCLDLFAGSGALGLEAASRGAAQVTLVDREAAVIENLRQQLVKLMSHLPNTTAEPARSGNRVSLVNSDDAAYLARCDTSFDLVFLDPPFDAWSAGEGWQQSLLESVDGVLANAAQVYLESPVVSADTGRLPAGWQVLRERTYGEVRARLYAVR